MTQQLKPNKPFSQRCCISIYTCGKNIYYLTSIQVRKNGSPTFIVETMLNDGRTKQHKLRSRWSNHLCLFTVSQAQPYTGTVVNVGENLWTWILLDGASSESSTKAQPLSLCVCAFVRVLIIAIF